MNVRHPPPWEHRSQLPNLSGGVSNYIGLGLKLVFNLADSSIIDDQDDAALSTRTRDEGKRPTTPAALECFIATITDYRGTVINGR
jgi:hypothetical protein